MSYLHWTGYIARGRNKYSRPVANNTHVHLDLLPERPSVSIRLHATDVVTFRADGAITVRHGGWTTPTTLRRIRAFSPAEVISNGGEWFIPFEHDPGDPVPLVSTKRTIPRPFHAPDPGPEPVDDGVGCIAGRSESYEAQLDRTIYAFQESPLDIGRGFPLPPDEWGRKHDHTELRVTSVETVTYGAAPRGGYDHQGEYRMCPHCKAFSELHSRWSRAMRSNSFYRGNNASATGYAAMCEVLETYGSREAWQQAYITELREVRENRKALKAWEERNLCPFREPLEITADGLVPLAYKPAHLRRLRARQRAEQRRKRVNAQHARELAEREQRRAEERRMNGLIAEALAESLFTGVEATRPRWHGIKAKHRQEAMA